MSRELDRFLAEALEAGGRAAWSEAPVVAASASPGRAVVEGRDRVLLCTNDYLGLALEPRVIEAAREAAARFGAGSRAARSLAGDTELHHELEQELADFKHAEAALLFGSGLATNVGVIAALTTRDDVILSDALNHASIVDGSRLSAARALVYDHADPASLEARLREAGGAAKRMIVTDAVFSMDGTIAPLPEIVRLAGEYDAFVMLDDAHATGVLGAHGEGTLEHFGLAGGVAVLMGTLGKALGSVGGFVAGSRDLVDFLARSARTFLFTTSLPPASVGAALAALRILRSEPERVERLWANARRLHGGFADLGLEVPAAVTPIIPVFLDDDHAASALSRGLYERGVVVQAIGAPYVPAGTSRLRVIASAAHTEDDLAHVLEAFSRVAGAAVP
jgi:glycine C-acetyltransferase